MAGRHDRRSGRGAGRPVHPYPRTARVNALLVEVIATSIERLSDEDPRLSLLTVTAVETEPDLRHATVLFASLPGPAAESLAEHRPALQRAIAKGGRMKRTPTLSFAPDPAVAAGERVEEALRRIHRHEP
ncbi:MAG TPA: ribosome-binding factor A [Acidimicrobiales bacterium]|nr:ribosome-binding factor A [Acidimicrobiales bacterium]